MVEFTGEPAPSPPITERVLLPLAVLVLVLVYMGIAASYYSGAA